MILSPMPTSDSPIRVAAMRRRSFNVKGADSADSVHAKISCGNRALWNLPSPRMGLVPSVFDMMYSPLLDRVSDPLDCPNNPW